MSSELVLLGTAGAPMPVAGRGGIASVLVVGERVFVIDCGRGAPSAYVNAGLDFRCLDAVFVTHQHADHIGDLPGMLLYPWGIRTGPDGPLPPIRVYGPRTTDLVAGILATYAYDLEVMPLDADMPDPGGLVRAIDVEIPAPAAGGARPPVVVADDRGVRVTAVAVTHGHVMPALAYRFDTPDGSVVFSGDTTVNDDLIALARGADILVHCVADLGYLERHGTTGVELQRMAGLHTDVSEVGGVAERAGVGELILTHYLPAEPEAIGEEEWQVRAASAFGGTTTAGRDGLRRVLRRAGG
jgi:ribonuclease BN (tRNA processing enzyme)